MDTETLLNKLGALAEEAGQSRDPTQLYLNIGLRTLTGAARSLPHHLGELAFLMLDFGQAARKELEPFLRPDNTRRNTRKDV